MTILSSLMVIVSLLSVWAEKIKVRAIKLQDDNNKISGHSAVNYSTVFLVFLVILILSLFSGLRIGRNDTIGYILYYMNTIPNSLSDLSAYNLGLADNPGFFIFQVLIKQYISIDPQALLLISAFIVNVIFVLFYYKYSERFGLSIFLYITSGLFVFTMAALKQTLAMAIGLLAVHYATRNKLLRSFLFLVLAVTIHPYVIVYGLVYFISDGTWRLREWFFMFLAFIVVFYFDNFIRFIVDINKLIGEEYFFETFIGTNVNIFRVLVYFVVPILSFMFRKNINSINEKTLNISINMSLLSFIFMFFALFGNAVMFTRMAIYFSPFIYLALPWILNNCFNKRDRALMTALCIIGYTLFFYYQYAVVISFEYIHRYLDYY